MTERLPSWLMVLGSPFLWAGLAHSQGGSWEIGYSFAAPTYETNGLTWDGQALWHTNDEDPIIYRIDPNGGKVLGEVKTRVPDQGDLEFAGGFVWVVSENDHIIHQIDPSSGKTVDTIRVLGISENPPGFRNRIQMEGLTFDGRHIWVDGGTNRIVKIDPVKRTQRLYVMPYEMGYLDGMTWAFDHLWIVTNNATIYELDPCSMGVLDRFDAPANVGAGPEGFAFDGENLWFADNELDQIYKIILKDKILTKRAASQDCNEGELLTKSPVSLAFGPEVSGGGFAGRVGYGAVRPAWSALGRPPRDALGRLADFPGGSSPAAAEIPPPFAEPR